jgi:uncharacterized protein YbjT (DUF2867 family)
LLEFLPRIKTAGNIASSLKADLPIPMIATKDIAHKIAEFLNALTFTGTSIFEMIGPRAITMTEATNVIGKSIGKPDLKYVKLTYQKAEEELIALGLKHQISKLIVEMHKAFNDGKIKPTQALTEEHKGKTTFEEFAKIFSQLYRSAKKAA